MPQSRNCLKGDIRLLRHSSGRTHVEMKKGSYTVQEGYVGGGVKGGGGGGGGVGGGGSSADSSYSACLLALLFFLALCIIIMLAAWPWSSGTSQSYNPAENGDRPQHEGYSGSGNTSKPPHGGDGHPVATPRPTQNTPGHHPTPAANTTASHPSTETPVHTLLPHEAEVPYHTDEPTTVNYHTGGDRNSTDSVELVPIKGASTASGNTKGKLLALVTTSTPKNDSTLTTTSFPEETSVVSDSARGSSSSVKSTAIPTSSTVSTPPSTRAATTTSPVHHVHGVRISPTESPETTPTTSSKHVHTVPTEPPVTTSSSFSETTVPPTSISTAPDSVTSVTPTTEESVGGETHSSTAKPLSPEDGDLRESKEDEIKGANETKVEACETSTCRSLSSRMLALMNHSAEPCENFYAYACGGMRAEGSHWIAEVVPGSESWSRIADMMHRIDASSPISHQKFKSFYDSCVFYDQHVGVDDRKSKVREILSSVGTFYRKDDWLDDVGNLTGLIGNLLKHHFSPLLDILLDVDSHNSSKFAIKLSVPVHRSPFGDSDGNEQTTLIGWSPELCTRIATEKPQGGIRVDFNERYKEYIKCNKNYQEYLKEVENAIRDLEMIQHLNNTESSKLIAETIIYLDMVLGEIVPKVLPDPGDKRRILLEKEFKTYTIKDLNKKFSLIDWNTLISMVLEDDVPEDTVIQVYFESYFELLLEHLEKAPITKRQLVNSLMAMFTHELYYGLVMNRNPCSRGSYCLTVAGRLMEDVSSALFLGSFDAGQLSAFHSKINTTFNDLIISLKSEISTIPWMDADSQIRALEKVRNMKVIADGGGSVLLNDTYLDAQLDEYAVNATYLENVISLMQRYRKRMYLSYKKNPSEPEQIWSNFLLPYNDHGLVIYGLNAIVVPYGMMSKPYFSEDFPSYIQMAGLGYMLAQEVWHHFDRTGILYGPDGLRRNLLTTPAMSKMATFGKCAEDQYSTEQNETSDDGQSFVYKLNPAISINERLADIGAAHLVYKSLWGFSSGGGTEAPLPWSSLTPKQLYFLSMAQNFCTKSSVYDYVVSIFEDEHLPPFRRMNDIAFNSREFAEAFSCPPAHTPRCEPFTIAKVEL